MQQIRRNSGFTLLELMIVVAIIGILASIAIPAFLEQIKTSKRTDGTAWLLHQAHELTRCRTASAGSTYVGCGAATTSISEGGYYNVSAVVTASTFTLSAALLNSGTDPECNTLTLTSAGVRGVSGSGSVDDCW